MKDGRDPQDGHRVRHPLAALFDVYLSRNVTSPGEAVVTFVDGALVRRRRGSLPPGGRPAQVRAAWGAARRWRGPRRRDQHVRHGARRGALHEPCLRHRGVARGCSSSRSSPRRSSARSRRSAPTGCSCRSPCSAVATAIAWPVAGRVLEPVRQLTETARSISESDMTQRVPGRHRRRRRGHGAELQRHARPARGRARQPAGVRPPGRARDARPPGDLPGSPGAASTATLPTPTRPSPSCSTSSSG